VIVSSAETVELHIDSDEAAAAGLEDGQYIRLGK